MIAEQGGLHKFMNWDKPILTDSGGFQVFSLGLQKEKKKPTSVPKGTTAGEAKINNTNNEKLVKIDEDGVTFRSHIDGGKHRFTPESAIECQHKIGADIIMAFDECTPDDADEKYVREAMERTHRWAERCVKEHNRLKNIRKSELSVYPYLFGIIQGSNYKHLREESAQFISSLDFDGIAIGGESIGYNMEATKNILKWITPIIPENKPHYTMGVGLNPSDLLEVVEFGSDMFDCVAPTRLARHGMLFVNKNIDKKLRINIKNAKFRNDENPIDSNCNCSVCQNYSRNYIHHLFDAGEMTGMRLASIHNLYFLLDLMKKAREAIKEDKFLEFKKNWM